MSLLPALARYIERISGESRHLTPERRALLDVLVDYVKARLTADEPVLLNFICTHNSRRSHLGQIWAAAMAHAAGLDGVKAHSGGTEATAFNPRAVAAIERAGFSVEASGEDNPIYRVTFDSDVPPLLCSSKVYDAPENPSSGFAAVMTCTDADRNCPVILGATRISLPYRDPKEADDTPQESSRYDERCRQIAAEMHYVFSHVGNKDTSTL
jgi:arsenate reductase